MAKLRLFINEPDIILKDMVYNMKYRMRSCNVRIMQSYGAGYDPRK